MSNELQRIAADIIIAKINNNSVYAVKEVSEIAEDWQTIYSQLNYREPITSELEHGKKHGLQHTKP